MSKNAGIPLKDDNYIMTKLSNVKIFKTEDGTDIIIDFAGFLRISVPGTIRGVIGDLSEKDKRVDIEIKTEKGKDVIVYPDTPTTPEQMVQLIQHDLYPLRDNKQFKRDALNVLDLTDHPKAEKAFELAWRQSHDVGYYEVLATLETLSELLVGENE